MAFDLKEVLAKTAWFSFLTAIFMAYVQTANYDSYFTSLGALSYICLVFFSPQIVLPINFTISYVLARAYYKAHNPIYVADLTHSNLFKSKTQEGLSKYSDYQSQCQTNNYLVELFLIIVCNLLIMIINWNFISFIFHKIINGVF